MRGSPACAIPSDASFVEGYAAKGRRNNRALSVSHGYEVELLEMMTSPVTLFPKHQATQKMLSLSQSAMSAGGSIDARREQTAADSDDYLASPPREKPYV
jgi:hypothetical protein